MQCLVHRDGVIVELQRKLNYGIACGMQHYTKRIEKLNAEIFGKPSDELVDSVKLVDVRVFSTLAHL